MKKINYWCFFAVMAIATTFIVLHATVKVWEPSHYLWTFGIIQKTDKGLNVGPEEFFLKESDFFDQNAFLNLKAGDIAWVKCRFVPLFCQHVLPKLTCPIVLLVSAGDESFPSNIDKRFDIENLLSNKYITHVFAQNCDYCGLSTKVSSFPIGMDFHTVAYKGNNGGWGETGSPREQEAKLNAILQRLNPTYQRKKRAFVDFQLADTMHGEFKRYLQFGEDRKSIFQKLLPTGLIEYGPWMKRSKVWEKKGEYAFSISPHGNGLDCHRTWEDLILGCIVIVKTSPLDSLYEGLPVIIVNDWSEITASNMDKWLALYGDAFTNPLYREKLTNDYWFSKIQAKADFCKSVSNHVL